MQLLPRFCVLFEELVVFPAVPDEKLEFPALEVELLLEVPEL